MLGSPILWVTFCYALIAWGTVLSNGALTLFALALFGVVQLTDAHLRATAQRIREALTLCGLQQKEAAYLIGLDPSDFQKALDGQRKLDLWRLEMLPEDFQRHYSLLVLRDRGLPDYARTALKVAAEVLSLPRKVSA